jgi:hypothetical protein
MGDTDALAELDALLSSPIAQATRQPGTYPVINHADEHAELDALLAAPIAKATPKSKESPTVETRATVEERKIEAAPTEDIEDVDTAVPVENDEPDEPVDFMAWYSNQFADDNGEASQLKLELHENEVRLTELILQPLVATAVSSDTSGASEEGVQSKTSAAQETSSASNDMHQIAIEAAEIAFNQRLDEAHNQIKLLEKQKTQLELLTRRKLMSLHQENQALKAKVAQLRDDLNQAESKLEMANTSVAGEIAGSVTGMFTDALRSATSAVAGGDQPPHQPQPEEPGNRNIHSNPIPVATDAESLFLAAAMQQQKALIKEKQAGGGTAEATSVRPLIVPGAVGSSLFGGSSAALASPPSTSSGPSSSASANKAAASRDELPSSSQQSQRQKSTETTGALGSSLFGSTTSKTVLPLSTMANSSTSNPSTSSKRVSLGSEALSFTQRMALELEAEKAAAASTKIRSATTEAPTTEAPTPVTVEAPPKPATDPLSGLLFQ